MLGYMRVKSDQQQHQEEEIKNRTKLKKKRIKLYRETHTRIRKIVMYDIRKNIEVK